MLRARHLTKTFDEGGVPTPVLKGVDLEIRAGEFVGLMGPSGSGKSTLLSILGTLLRPTSGEVEIVGHRVDHLTDREVTEHRNRHIGFVFQFHHLLPDFTALENVLFPALPLAGRVTLEARARARDLLERVGLADRLEFRPAQLSGGQRQRVAVARAIMNEPEVVLADEPTGNLDIGTSDRVMELMLGMSAREGTSFLVSTHEPRIAAVCDRVVHIVDGRIRPGGPDAPAERPTGGLGPGVDARPAA
ncbi:MAG: ABC transporter ATP-binding protein [Gemmatimonadota bacterium]